MSLNIWLAFIAVVFVVSGSPGPNMLLSLTHGIHHGLTRTFSTMLGLLSGLAVILAVSLYGLGAVLVASTTAFSSIWASESGVQRIPDCSRTVVHRWRAL
jgi:threonine/homoserine/homoserine lactone efflux protein